jgi:hypothetical protein
MKRSVEDCGFLASFFFPDDVWNSIFPSLLCFDQKELIRLTQVSQRLGSLVYNFIHSLEITTETPLSFLLKLDNLVELYCLFNKEVNMDNTIKLLTKLTKIDLSHAGSCVTETGLSTLTNLTDLFMGESSINDLGLRQLTNLTYLNIYDLNGVVSDESFSKLLKLEKLVMVNGGTISDSSLSLLTNLTTFKIDDNFEDLTESSLYNLTKLRDLDIWHIRTLSDRTLSRLTLLEKIHMNTDRVTDQSLQLLTKLTLLEIGVISFTSDALLKLTNLTTLINPSETLTDELLSPPGLFPKLTSLILPGTNLSDNVISKFTNLTHLAIGGISLIFNLQLTILQVTINSSFSKTKKFSLFFQTDKKVCLFLKNLIVLSIVILITN